jgi:subtilisin family serine protease
VSAPIVPTGSFLVKFERGLSTSERRKILQRGNGHVAVTSDYGGSDFNYEKAVLDSDAFLMERIGVAVLRGDGEIAPRCLEISDTKGVTKLIPEFLVFAYDDGGSGAHEDTELLTWGVAAVGAGHCRFTGKGIKIGVLDTGFDRNHPAFSGRNIRFWSVFGCGAGDVRGHGTHCAGTAAGAKATPGIPRFGVAPDADLHIYKVLNDSGYGRESHVLEGIDRALTDECDVISMSFGRSAGSGTVPNAVFEDVAKEALESGTLMIAAAGNTSSRDIGHIAPIDYPANSPSIMAVAAVDSRLAIANFSSAGSVGGAGIDVAAPGSGVFSSAPMPQAYQRLRGTSMAAPHVAGVACLWAETDLTLRGQALWNALISNARSLGISQKDVGAGLVQAPFTEH